MKLSALLNQLAVDLNDAEMGFEFTTWTREQLRAYVAEALQTLFTERPDLFMEVKVIEVTSCDTVQDDCDCDRVHKVFGQSTEKGRVIKTLRRRSSSEKLIWRGKPCPVPPERFELREYSIDPRTGTLQLFPVVPPDVKVWVKVECSVRPDTDNMSDDMEINPEFLPMIKQWVMYSAKIVDGENNAAIIQVARDHRAAFWELVTANKQAKKEEEKVDKSNNNSSDMVN